MTYQEGDRVCFEGRRATPILRSLALPETPGAWYAGVVMRVHDTGDLDVATVVADEDEPEPTRYRVPAAAVTPRGPGDRCGDD
jgi:hypothetical protein